MQYSVLHIQTAFDEEWQKDLFDQQLCDLGVDTIDAGLEPGQKSHADYYIPSALWLQNRSAITSLLSSLNFQFSVSEVPDENWNAVWEAEHPVQELPMGVKIIPHCAFGAGHHETTGMMIDELLNHQSSFVHRTFVDVLDNGCGTGVLGIFAKKLGAEKVIAIDIDDKSVANTIENAALNGVEIDARLGNLSALDFYRSARKHLSTFDLILANIHRNILLEQMPYYARLLRTEGELWISGFYETDCPSLLSAAEANGLQHLATHAHGDWRMMTFKRTTEH